VRTGWEDHAMVDGYATSAVEVGRRRGLPADEPEVLAFPVERAGEAGPAVARVPATTLLAWPDVADWMAWDVALSTFLAERDTPVIPPFETPARTSPAVFRCHCGVSHVTIPAPVHARGDRCLAGRLPRQCRDGHHHGI
jgi:hypothetical protein